MSGDPAASARDPLVDAFRGLLVGQAGADGRRDGAGVASRATDIRQRTGNVAAPQVVLAAIGAVRAQAQVVGVGAAGEVALVAQHRVIGAGPAQPGNDPVFELVGEQVRGTLPRRDGPGRLAARKTGKGRVFRT